ncbi:MAG: DUF1461 domain-containing protein [Chloroflexota bacterium]
MAICLPVLLFSSGLRLSFNEVRLYEYGFDKHQVTLLQPTDRARLSEIAREIISYWNSAEKLPGAALRRVFSTPEETEHLQEVKALVRRAYRAQGVSLGVVLAALAAGYAAMMRRGGAFRRWLVNWLVVGSGITVSLIMILAVLAFTAFDWLWWQLHLVAFPGSTLWILDPGIHNMIRMFPGGFWFDATVFVTGGVAAAALLIGGSGVAYLRSTKGVLRNEPG